MRGENTSIQGERENGGGDSDPLWLQIYRALRQDIRSGQFSAGARLPSEKQLCDRFAVTRMTVRRALRALQREGMLTARKGSGVFINRAPTRYQITDGKRFIDNISPTGDHVSTKTLSITREAASEEFAVPLQLPPGAGLITIVRLRFINAVPTFLNCKRLVADRFPDFDDIYPERQSVDDVYRAHGLAGYRRIETKISGGFASPEEASRLDLSTGSPVIRTQTLNEDDAGVPIEFSRGCWVHTAVEFVFPRSGDGVGRTD